MSKHTPGPWVISRPNGPSNGISIESTGAWPRLPEAWLGCRATSEEQIANAHLIAAAPELLDFAKEWLAQQGSDNNYMTQKAKEAIAKAEGGQ